MPEPVCPYAISVVLPPCDTLAARACARGVTLAAAAGRAREGALARAGQGRRARLQLLIEELGGARLAEYDLGEVGLGQARRSGVVASSSDGEAADGLLAEAPALESSMDGADSVGSGDAVDAMGAVAGVDGGAQAASAPVALRALDRRCKRKKEDMAI